MPLPEGDEIGVLVDDEDRELGPAQRREIRTKNLLHRGVVVLVRDPGGRIYVHRRTASKDVYPGVYDIVVGGMVLAGETYEAAARREIEEELGIVGPEPRFLFKDRYRDESNNAWMAVFEVTWEGPIRHQPEEISWGAWLTLAELASRLEAWPFAPDHLSVFRRALST